MLPSVSTPWIMRQGAETTGCETVFEIAGRHLSSPNGICSGFSSDILEAETTSWISRFDVHEV